MNTEKTEVNKKPSLWERICAFFAELVTPVDIPPREEKWNEYPNNLDVYEKHWRYSPPYYGFDRWMLMI